ncbi:xylulose kinase [Catenulispora sp. NF23]|uniref:xylulokinase n=1 Tax=Catenulispora pinistramenti TaxID=2705254 RepID=UPI001BA5F55B|nr:FGGY family carbohydrate kinase [Catenulispora pinistramenti]MBS2537036.1 xylulose kinase [Catenulispora pinistramenti]
MIGNALVAGIDSATRWCQVVIRDAATGERLRAGAAPHPDGTEVHPSAWWEALGQAVAAAGGLEDVAAVSIAGQQHGMVCLDDEGAVVRPALLWNDTRSARAAADLVAELGGPAAWADAVGTVPVAALTVAKLRWLAGNEPARARATAAVCLPHDWLTWKLGGGRDIRMLTTDRSDASGTGYYSPAADAYRPDLVQLALGRQPLLPKVLGPAQTARILEPSAGFAPADSPRIRLGAAELNPLLVAAGSGDNAAAALGLGAGPGDVVVSIGTSGTVFACYGAPTADPTGAVAGFADATGGHLPLVCTLNAARVLDAAAALLGVSLGELSRLALSAPAGADGLTLIPYLEGERTPNRPDATGTLHGLRLTNSTPAHLARAYIEGMLCGLADGLDALSAVGVPVERILLVGGAARSEAVRTIAPAVLGRPVLVPRAGDYVADGAAKQAAWALNGSAAPPAWDVCQAEKAEAEPVPWLRERYHGLRDA